MNRPCLTAITCPGTDDPVLNLSSEAFDGVNFTALWWPFILVGGPFIFTDPPSTVLECESLVSADDAWICAYRRSFLQSQTPTIPGISPPEIFYNSLQVCNRSCPDGSIIQYAIAGGQIPSTTQYMADLIAAQLACILAAQNMICFTAIFDFACKDQAFDTAFNVNGGPQPFTIALVSGSLPPGLTLNQISAHSAEITGTPTTPGDYTFGIRATSQNGRYATKTYQISVIELGPASLPDGSIGTPYSQTLTAPGMLGVVTWQLESGALPAGLSLNSATGEISGTPT